MRNAEQTSPKLRVRREVLRQLTVAELRLAVGGTWVHGAGVA
jgi:hypothetical protein